MFYIDKRSNLLAFELLHVTTKLHMSAIVSLLLLSLISHACATGPLCHICDDVLTPSDCPNVMTCQDHEQCFVQKLRAPTHREYFKLGCISRNTCLQNQTTHVQPVGRRDENGGRDSANLTSYDVTSLVRRARADPGDSVLCSECANDANDQLWKCGSSPDNVKRCLHCSYVSNPHDCDSVVQCGNDEQCFIGLQPSPLHNGALFYSMGCQRNAVCANLQTVYHAFCLECCATSYCNIKLCNDSATKTTTHAPTAATTTLPGNHRPVVTIVGPVFVDYNTSVTLTCQTDVHVESYIWTLDAHQLTTARSPTLTIPALNANTTGTYRCTAIRNGQYGYADHTIRIKSNSLNQAKCDFEVNALCSWRNVHGHDDFDWVLYRASTPTDDTGPDFDHTTRNSSGSYIFTESSAPRNLFDKAWIESPTIEVTPDPVHCFRFWYHMYGSSIGQLNVYQVTNGGLPGNLVWSLTGDQGNSWKEGQVPLNSSQSYSILLSGVVGNGYQGDIAIDDVTVSVNYCDVKPPSASRTDVTNTTFTTVGSVIYEGNHSAPNTTTHAPTAATTTLPGNHRPVVTIVGPASADYNTPVTLTCQTDVHVESYLRTLDGHLLTTARSSTLKIPVLNANSTGTYRCTAMTYSQSGYADHRVRIKSIPAHVISFTKQKDPQSGVVLFTCVYEGYPLPIIDWSFAGVSGTHLGTDVHINDARTYGMISQYNSKVHDGNYTCGAKNFLGGDSKTVTLP